MAKQHLPNQPNHPTHDPQAETGAGIQSGGVAEKRDYPGGPDVHPTWRNPKEGDPDPRITTHEDLYQHSAVPPQQGTYGEIPRRDADAMDHAKLPHHPKSESEDEPLTHEQWQSLPAKQRGERPAHLGGVGDPNALSDTQRVAAQGIHPGLGFGDVAKYSTLIFDVIRAFETLTHVAPGDHGDLPPIKSRLPGGRHIELDSKYKIS